MLVVGRAGGEKEVHELKADVCEVESLTGVGKVDCGVHSDRKWPAPGHGMRQ